MRALNFLQRLDLVRGVRLSASNVRGFEMSKLKKTLIAVRIKRERARECINLFWVVVLFSSISLVAIYASSVAEVLEACITAFQKRR